MLHFSRGVPTSLKNKKRPATQKRMKSRSDTTLMLLIIMQTILHISGKVSSVIGFRNFEIF